MRLPQVPLPPTVKVTSWPTWAVEGAATKEVIVGVTVTTVTRVPLHVTVPVAVTVKEPAVL